MSAHPVILSVSLVRTFLKIDLMYSFTIGSANPSSAEIELILLSFADTPQDFSFHLRKGTSIGIEQLDDGSCHCGCVNQRLQVPAHSFPAVQGAGT